MSGIQSPSIAGVLGAGAATEATLASIDGKIPSLGQALAASSVPVVLTAAQLTTLTPPAAITGFATETTLAAVKTAVEIIDNFISGTKGLVTEDNSAAIAASLSILDDWDETNRAAVNPIAGQVGVQAGAGAVTALTQRVAIATDANAVTAVGTVADDSTTPGNPVMVGGMAVSPDGTDPGSVAEADVVRFKTDLNRRILVNDEHPNHWSYHENSSNALTDQAVAADPGDGFQLVITEIDFSTGAATACNIFFEEGATTILGPFYLEAVAGRGLFWRGKKFVTASTALTVTTSAAIAHGLDVRGFIQAV